MANLIFKNQSNKGGVYKITNTISNKFYIGSTGRFKGRWQRHISSLRGGRHRNKHLQYSWNRYGESVFVFEILEVVSGSKLIRTKREQKYLDGLSQKDWEKCYNQKRKVIFSDGPWSNDPNQTKKKKSLNQKRLWKNVAYRQAMTSKKFGKRNGNSKKRKFVLYREIDSYYKEFHFQFEAVHELNLTRQGLYAVLSGKKHSHKGYKGKYLE